MSDDRSRTPDEREAARRERELRRAARDGGGARPSPSPAQPPAPQPPLPAPAPPPTFVSDARTAPAAARPQSERSHALEDPPHEPEEFTDEHELIEDRSEVPSGIRRAYRTARDGRMPRAGRHPEGVRRPPSGSRTTAEGSGSHSRAGRALAALALVLGIALIWFLISLFQPFHGPGEGSLTVTIPAHTSSSQVGDLLERDGVVSSGFFFGLRALLSGERSNLRAGTYHLRRDMSYGAALGVLTAVPPPAKVTNLTIIEGKARRQVGALLRSQGVSGSYLAVTRRSRLLDPHSYGAPRSGSTLEGFLFPSTYQLREPISVQALADAQLASFRERFAKVDLGYARSRLHLTPYDILIVASMIQGEAQVARDRPLIASVIYNRLAAKMPLQIDATVRFASGNYTTPITVSQLASSSSYNTYVHKGLPPGPINSPGLASIQAAAHPAGTNYLYFVVKPCGNGEHAFASSYAQFLAEVNQYQVARTKRGGRSPAHC